MDSKNQRALKGDNVEAKIDAVYTDPGSAGGYVGEELLWRELLENKCETICKEAALIPFSDPFPKAREIPAVANHSHGVFISYFCIFLDFLEFLFRFQVDLADFQKLTQKMQDIIFIAGG